MSPEKENFRAGKEFESIRDFRGQDILSARQFDRENLAVLFAKTGEMKKRIERRDLDEPLKGYILASLFLESSTQTRTGLEVAMLRLGGQILQIPSIPGQEKLEEGSLESKNFIEDTIQMVASHPVDVIVLRHPHSEAAKLAAYVSSVPIINAGDGIGENPSQGLSALYTVREQMELDGATVTLGGNLKYSRTLHSLALLLSRYDGVKLNLVSPVHYLRMPEKLVEELKNGGVQVTEVQSFEELNKNYGAVVLTRVESERLQGREQSAIAANLAVLDYIYPLTPEIASRAKIVLSPIPRKSELEVLPQTAYYQRIENGVPLRMALLSLILTGN